MNKTLLAISTFLIGVTSVALLSAPHIGNAASMESRVISVSEVCFVDSVTHQKLSGLDDESYYDFSPYDIALDDWEWSFYGVQVNDEDCYDFRFYGAGTMELEFNLPSEYRNPTGTYYIHAEEAGPYPQISFQLDVRSQDLRDSLGSLPYFDISDYLANDTNDYGAELQDYAELAQAYAEMASDYADEACDEADAAEAARQSGDYEAFQEHMENSQAAAEAAQAAANQSAEYANAARDIADSASDGDTTTNGGLELDIGWWSGAGLGNTYDIEDLEDIWGPTETTWSAEDLMGVYIDPTWGMENIPTNWDYKIYVDPEYWADPTIFMEEFYGQNREEDYYLEATDFYESMLIGDDLYEFQNNADYHDYLINVYVNTYSETAAYQATLVETYTQGHLSYESYAENIAGQVAAYETDTLGTFDASYWNMNSADSYFGMENKDTDYLAAVNYFESNLTGSDLTEFQTDESYHNYLVNSYINGMTESPSFESELSQTLDAGVFTYESFNNNFTSMAQFEMVNMTTQFQTYFSF